MTTFISKQAETALSWGGLLDAFEAGHQLPEADIKDSFLYRGDDTLLSRAAWIDGLGQVVKTATIFPSNQSLNLPKIHGGVMLFSDMTGELDAVIDFHLVTKWKTAGDSLFAAKQLARTDAKTILIVGAGTVASSMIAAYSTVFPKAQFIIWARTAQSGQGFEAKHNAQFIPDLEQAVAQADIICTATITKEPLIKGAWLKPGQHLDLIGAYRPDMREVDDEALQRASVFVDSFETTLDHIGELKIPLASGAISRSDVLADFYAPDAFKRTSPDEITIAKNGGGAHLDLMTCRYILDAWKSQ